MPEGVPQEGEVKELDEWDVAAQESVSKPPSPTTTQQPSLAFIVSQVCHFYPGEFRGGDIGWSYFWMLYNNLYRITAIHRVTMTQSALLSGGVMNATDASKPMLQREVKRDINIAQGLI